MDPTADVITRREAVLRMSYLLGGALSAPTIAGVLAGCQVPADAAAAPRTLTREQSEMVLIMGEHILPETDTPGARAARVNEYIDVMLTDYYPAADRDRFLAGLERANARAKRAFGTSYLELAPRQQLDVAQALNRAAFQSRGRQAAGPATNDPVLQQGGVVTGEEHVIPPVLDSSWDPEDLGGNSFFGTLKELVLVGYYTSEIGSTQELRVNPMGVWLADVPYSQIGRAWA